MYLIKRFLLGLSLIGIIFFLDACKDDDQSPIPTEGLILYYPFNGNALDESGNGLDGNVNGDIEFATDRFGNTDAAFEFDGNDDVVTLPPDDQINLDGFTDSYTFSIWFQTNDPTPINTTSSRLIEKWDLNNGTAYPISVQMFDDSIRTIIYDAINLNGPTHIVAIGDFTNSWTHFAFVNDIDKDQSRIYINGNLLVAVENKTTGSTTNNEPYTIGNNQRLDRGFPGKIDDIRIYNRVLTENEIDILSMEQ